MDVLACGMASGIHNPSAWFKLFADDIVLCSNRKEEAEKKLDEWRRVTEDRGLNISTV